MCHVVKLAAACKPKATCMLASLSFGHAGFSHNENFIVEIVDFFVGSVDDYCSKHFCNIL
jgi:hypothetical protein